VFEESFLDLVSDGVNFPERLMLRQVIFQMTSQKASEKLTLLRNEVSRPSNHFAEPGVHFMLIMATRHSNQLAKLLKELMHCKHSCSKGLAFFVDIFCAFDHLIIENLIRVNKIYHFAAKHCAV